MKRFSNLTEKIIFESPLWTVFLVFLGPLTILVATIFYLLDNLVGDQTISLIRYLTLGLILGGMCSLLAVFIVSMFKMSDVFWQSAKEVHRLIHDAETLEQLSSIFEKDFKELRKKSGGGPHRTELLRLHTIMDTKYRMIEKYQKKDLSK